MKYADLKKIYLTGYRTVGFIFLASITAALVGYGGLMVFFLFNDTWVAPTVMSQTSDKMLTFAAGYLNSTQQQSTAQITYDQAVRQVAVLTEKESELNKMLHQSDLAMKAETKVNGLTVGEAGKLMVKKTADIKASEELQAQLARVKKQTEDSLRAGLITRDEAAQTFAAIQTFSNSVTDSQSALLSLDQQTSVLSRARATLLGAPSSVDAMIAVKAYADIQILLLQNESDLKTAQDTTAAAGNQLKLANGIVANLKETSYMAGLTTGANLAFVPYDNADVAKIGAPVYDCYLLVIACHQVGTIKHVYHDEQLVDFPIFNVRLSRTVRGTMVDLEMTDPKYMSSLIFFVHKPLFI